MKAAGEAKKMIREGVDVIKLDVGEPDFDTPLHIKAAGIEAIQDGSTKYTPAEGTPKIRNAIAQKLERENHLHYAADEITIAPGAKQAIYNALVALLDPEDEVLLPTPYWPSYLDMIKLAGGKAKKISTTIGEHFKISPKKLSSAITPRTKLLILNSPNNPSGAVYTQDELKALGKVLEANKHVFVLSDDVYERIYLHHDHPAPHLLQSAPKLKKQCLIVNSLSKTYAMTGWRLGYACGPKKLIEAMSKIQSQTGGASSSIAQRAGIDALSKQSQSCIAEMLNKYEQRHQVLCQRLDQLPLFDYIPAKGAFYLFVNIKQAMDALDIKSDVLFCEKLLEEAHVSCVAGTPFGLPNHMRISFASKKAKIHEAFDRIEAFLSPSTTQ